IEDAYDVYVYAQGGVGGRGGGFRILDDVTGVVLKDYVRAISPTNPPTYIEVPQNLGGTNNSGPQRFGVGNYIVFQGLTAPSIRVIATTGGGLGTSATPRAPINAMQLVC